MTRDLGMTGVSSWLAVNRLIDMLERQYPGIRAATYARARAALKHDTIGDAAAILAIMDSDPANS